MQARASTALCALALAAVACNQFDADLGGASASSPHPTSIEPGSNAAIPTAVTIRGDNFILRTTQSVPGGTPTVDPPLDQQYHAWLDGVELEAVTWQDSSTLRATVPGGLSVGTKTLVVENAFGNRGQLDGAYEVLAGSALIATIAATPSTVSFGQAITLTLTVTNAGGADLTGVTPAAPTISSANGATAELSSGPTPATVATLAPGASRDFTWVYTPTAPGTLDMSTSASGEDASSHATVTSNAPGASVTIQAGAGLSVPLALSPPTASVGQTITMVMTVTNDGDAGVNNVTPGSPTVTTSDTGAAALATGPTPTSVGFLPPGESATFTWTFTATAAGHLTFSASASGRDANSGATVSGHTTATNAVLVQAAPTLGGVMSAPASVSTDQAFTLTLTFTKGGTAPANVTAVTNPSGCVNPTPATRTDVQTGDTITWSCTAPATEQSLSLTSTVSWVDANDPGTTLTFTPAPASVAVVAGASLTGAMSAPAEVSANQAFTSTLTFTKVGTAPANVTAVTNPSGCVNPTPATLTDVQTGQTITWSCTAPVAPESLSLTSTVSWVDANTPGTTLTFTPTPASVTVVAAASLAVTTFAANPTVANAGQAVNVTLTLRNDGGATANVSSVSTSIVPGVEASCTAASPAMPPAQTIAGGTSLTFAWTCSSTRAGVHTLHTTVTATDANSGASVSPTVTGISVTIQNPAALTATIAATTANGGENVTLTLTVTNTGGATANDVTPGTPTQGGTGAASIVTAPAASSVPGGGQASFVWTYTAAAAGSVTFTVGASGTDANSGATVTAAPVTSPAVAIVPPAALSASIEATPATVSVGQTIAVTLTVTNSGGTGAASATDVVPSAPTLDPSSGATLADGPSPASVATLATGANATFTWHYTASAAGSLTFSASATGTDAINPSLRPSSNTATSPAVTVQAAAALVATDIAATADAGSVVLTLTVTNGGEATANAVGPAAGMPIVTGTGAATVATPPTPFDLGAGAANTLTWIYTVTAAGTLTFSAAASGTDANSGATVTSNTLTTVEVPVTALSAPQALAATRSASEAVLVATDPFGDGTPAALVNAYQGGAWVGPSRDGQRLVRFDPSGSAAPSSAALALAVDVGPTPASTWPADRQANALGAPGCTAGVGCAHDEAGGGLVLAGTLGGREWLGLSGVSAGGSRYLYATSSSADPLDFAWVDLLAAFQAASAASWVPSAALFVPGAPDRLYLGYAGPGSSHGSLLFALLVLPAGPGFDAVPGMDVLDLAAVAMPGVAGTAGVPGITALANLQGILYVAHEGGLIRATTATPSSAATTPGDWAQATPSAAAWSAKTPVPLPGTAGLSPRDRAVPALAAFGACGEGPCVFAVRNVRGSPSQPAVVPQLWRCSPTAGPGRCAPGDWSLAAPNTSGDTLLTQLGDETNGAATVLVVTAKWLYLGFDNGSTGVQLYRAAIAPRSIADFEGRDGCAAGTAGCQGLGGNGFGDPAVARVFDAKALTFGERTSLWFTAGDGVGPVRVYRIDDTATASATAEPRPVPVAAGRAAGGGGCSSGGASAGALLAALGLALLRRRSGGRARSFRLAR